MVNYDWKGGSTAGSVWGGYIYQGTGGEGSFDARGYELGAKLGLGNFEAVLYGFDGEGLGLSTVGALYFSPAGKTDGRGYFVQGTYKFGKTKVGLNYGQNRDSGGTLTKSNKFRSATFGVYHSLNKYITLVGEYNQERSDGPDGVNAINSGGNGDLETRTISLGGIIFF